jgi:hypothetical protein
MGQRRRTPPLLGLAAAAAVAALLRASDTCTATTCAGSDTSRPAGCNWFASAFVVPPATTLGPARAVVPPAVRRPGTSSGSSTAIGLKLLTRDDAKKKKKARGGKRSPRRNSRWGDSGAPKEAEEATAVTIIANGDSGEEEANEHSQSAPTEDEQRQPLDGHAPEHQHQVASASTTDVFDLTDSVVNVTDLIESFSRNVTLTIEDINRQMTDGTRDILGNVTEILEGKLPDAAQQPQQQQQDVLAYLAELNEELARTQRREMERQMMELEKVFVRPLEDFAFSDAKLATLSSSSSSSSLAAKKREVADEAAKRRELEEHRRELVLTGANSTVMETSRRLKTSEILRNLNVAPLYYSLTLLFRWINKVKGPPMAALSFLRGLSALFGSPSKVRGGRIRRLRSRGKRMQSYEEFMKDANQMQAGWKRTGEIAAKGSLARKWAIMRRSAEIWGYFASFYLKEKRMENKFSSGKWSEERYSEERSKLGAEVTQNLLKLGPTFIKVGQLFSTRIDIVPKEYIEQLKNLQDKVPPFSSDIAVQIIEEELGKPIDELFDTFNRTSLAAVSLVLYLE